MALIRDIVDWLAAVYKAYHGWLAGSAFVVLVALGQSLGWWKPTHKTYGILILIGLVVSVFEAWRTEHSRAEMHQAPEIMLDYKFAHGEEFTGQEPINIRNTGKGTAFRIDVKVADDSFRPLFDVIPYLAEGDKLPLVQHGIVDSDDKFVGGISIGRYFLTYLRKLKSEGSELNQLVFRIVTVSYENEHGMRFAQDFRASYNVVGEDSRMFPWGRKKRVKPESRRWFGVG